MSCSIARAFALGLVAAAAAGPGLAAERQPFEMAKGWEVERTVGDTGANPCLMTHGYKDADDDNAENVIVFKLDGAKAVLVLGYEHWAWDKDEKVTVPFLAGKKTLNAKSVWTGNGKYLRGVFQDTLVPDLLAAKTITLKLTDAEAAFEIPDFAAGYASLRRCDAAPAAKTAATPPAATPAAATPAAPAPAPAPALPSEARMTTYMLGRIVQQVMAECEVSTTAKQRSAVDAKVAEMKPEMTAIESQVSEQLGKRDPRCPPAGDEPKFQTTLKDFLEKTPDDFVAAIRKREEEARAKPAP